MKPLITRLEKIQEATGGKAPIDKQKEELEKTWDDFTKLRKQIAAQVKDVRTVTRLLS